MPRRLLIGLVVGGCLALGTGLVVWAGTQGLFGPHGRAKQLLAVAERNLQRNDVEHARANLEELVGTFPDSPWTDQGLLKLGEVYEQQGNLTEARSMYRLLLDRFPESPQVGEAQTHLGSINVALLFSEKANDTDTVYQVKSGDTLGGIATSNKTTIDLIKRANALKNDVIRPGQKLKVPKAKLSIAVDKSTNQLLLTSDNQFFKIYTVSTGKDNSTPVGTFKIVTKVANPVWYHEGAAVPPESPDNILGTRWMGLDKPSYGIHGTTDPDAMGQQVTAGCVRMVNSDVEELFAIVPVGTEVTITD